MSRIADAELERLKTAVSLVRLVEAAGVELKKHGAKDLIGRCPFHNDKTPSLVVSPAKNLWHCLGACGVGGSVVDWVMRVEKVSFRHAVELLRADLPQLAAGTGQGLGNTRAVSRRTAPVLPVAVKPDENDQRLLGQIVGFYHDALKQEPECQAYLDKRGLLHPELIETFQLGYANRTLGYRLSSPDSNEGKAVRGQLQRLGVLRPSGHEHFRGSLVIPITDADGNVVQMYGRKTRDDLRPGTATHVYLPGPQRGVFNVAGLAGQQEVILCEALIDALTFWAAGYRNVTSSYGVHGFTKEHLAAFQQHDIKRVLIAYDRDDAGNTAAGDLAKKLIAEGFDVFRVLFPKGMDANSYALSVTPASKSLGLAIRKAEWLGKGKAPVLTSSAAVILDDVSVTETEATVAAVEAEPESVAEAETTPTTSERDSADVVDESASEKPSSLAADVAESPDPLDELETLLDARDPAPLTSASVSPVAPPPVADIAADVTDREVSMSFGDRRYRVRGLDKNLSYEVLKVNLLVARHEAIHVDTFDLYSAKHRQGYARAAAAELGVEESALQRDLGRVLLKLEALQDALIQKTLTPEKPVTTLSPDDERAALELLRDPNLAARLIDDIETTGLVGEPVNALVGYLSAVSRKLAKPLAIIIQSTSAAGKSALMDAVLDLVPEEDRIHYSAMTGQSLFYLGERDLKHKILAIAEEEGVRQASYALKLLQSQGELTIASTGKDPQSGKLVTEEYRVEGPVMLLLTTTAIDIDEELLNRCLVLTINESREQTRRIQERQRKARTLDGLLQTNRAKAIQTLHRNAQRLLRPLAVVNPYAEHLTFLDERTRTRRDHQKYLTLIDAIALLHQHQRPIKRVPHNGQVIEYVEVTVNDIALANRLAHDVLGRSLDELPPQTRLLLQHLHAMVTAACERQNLLRAEYRFTRRDVRAATHWGDTQLKVHLARLVEMEYVHVHRRGQTFVYELVYAGEGANGEPFLNGLIDVERLVTTADRSGLEALRSAPGRGAVGGLSALGRIDENAGKPHDDRQLDAFADETVQNARPEEKNPASSVSPAENNRNPSSLSSSLAAKGL